MRWFIFVFVAFAALTGCATSGGHTDPYPGDGGLLFGTPSQADVASGRAVYDESKFASFVIGKTTKSDVVKTLGRPAAWMSGEDGTSQLMYHFVDAQPSFLRRVHYVTFIFDKAFTLTRVDLPKK